MPAVLVNYCYDPVWLKAYPDLDVTIYDRSDDNEERNLQQYGKVFKTENIGDVDYDKLGYLIEHYDDLPDIFLWSKTNLFKFIDPDEWEGKRHATDFTPLLTQRHETRSDRFGPVNHYAGGMYYERADSWYFFTGLDKSGRYNTWQDWALDFGLPLLDYIPFAPGGSYILTRERVHRYSRDFYERMRDTLGYAAHPVEAHCCERSYFLLWR